MKEFTKRIPTPITGLILGLAALGNLLQSYGDGIRNTIGAIAGVLFLLFVVKILLHKDAFRTELGNPVIASVFATFPMATMILATYMKANSPDMASVVWILGILLHVIVMAYFTVTFVLNLKWPQVFASWFIVYVGIAVAAVTAGAFGYATIGKIAFWVGFISLLALLPVVTKRYSMKIEEQPITKPLIAIYAAPAALCLSGLVNSKASTSTILVWFLLILSQALYVFVLTKMPKLLKLPFMPSYSAFTFPFVISALSLKLANGMLSQSNPVPLLGTIVKIEEAIAVILVFYVLLRYLQFIFVTSQQTAK